MIGLAYVQLSCVTDVGLVCVVERYDLTELKEYYYYYYYYYYCKVTDLSGVSLACYEEVSDKLWTYYEEVTRKLLPWNLALSIRV